jgi:hypothetical protein
VAQAGGGEGRTKVQQCPGQASAEILAGAWLGGRPEWRELAVSGSGAGRGDGAGKSDTAATDGAPQR